MTFCNCLDAEVVQATDYDGAYIRRTAKSRIVLVDGSVWTARVTAAPAAASLGQQGSFDTKGKLNSHIVCFYFKHYNIHIYVASNLINWSLLIRTEHYE